MKASHCLVFRPVGSLLFGLALALPAGRLPAQETAPAKPEPLNWTTQQDHQNMKEQLGIKRLRPGPSGQPNATNAANYDPAKANPFPHLPELLVTRDGRAVTNAAMWWRERRPEIIEDFEREVIGRVPKNVPEVTWTITNQATDRVVAGIPVNARQLVGKVNNSACPSIEVNIQMTLVTPRDARAPVPVLMMFGGFFGGGGMPRRPGEPEPTNRFRGFGSLTFTDPPSTEQLITAGWGYATINPASIQADSGAGLTKGIIGLCNQGQPRKPDDWGALRAWAWGAARALDYLETDPTVDAKKVGIEGVSRFGKAALITMAFEPRFAVALVGSSGEGGAKLHRRNFGEAVENLTGAGGYHWMAGNFLKYGAAEATFGSKNAGDLPVDAHQLIALCAPRPVFISYGIPEKGDALWLDQQGSFMAAVAAGPAYRLLGARDLGVTEDYRTAQKPAVNVGLLDGELAWRQHDGGHEDRSNMKHFIAWANKLLGHTPPPPASPAK
ncbi:MAG TPA: acetylxylan esterase [Methylomirabilota bacterium]|nr:acetylxylan esterase [Methylomirabilota bacterium]